MGERKFLISNARGAQLRTVRVRLSIGSGERYWASGRGSESSRWRLSSALDMVFRFSVGGSSV